MRKDQLRQIVFCEYIHQHWFCMATRAFDSLGALVYISKIIKIVPATRKNEAMRKCMVLRALSKIRLGCLSVMY